MDYSKTIDLSSDEVVSLLKAASTASPHERSLLEERVVTSHLALAARIAARYSRRGIDPDDLRQVANLALVGAVRRFDPDRGDFIAFAAVTISGEVKKYFRDNGWMVRPPRSIQVLQAAIVQAEEERSQQGGAAFSLDELAAELKVDRAAVIDAAAARGCFAVASLDAPVLGGEGRALGESMAADGVDLDFVDGWVDFRPAWRTLDAEEKQLLTLRFFDDLTQDRIAQVIGCSQMQVSRKLRSVLGKIRGSMSTPHAA